ncbi:MAG: SDR family NAD(P)-dependent oxidoreductase [Solirubrobacterales bacterium]|nr:SDR family NAD(P)-dependent oxidoreductase [Solirubrobacterales bacterium]
MQGALVTGAGGGIGRAVAARLARRGFAVQVTDIDGDAAERAAAEIGGESWACSLDVTDEQACRAAAASTAERAGSLDVWVNNAGILLPGVAYEQAQSAHRAMLDVNAVGTFNGTLAALESMRPAGRGHVINIISLAGLVAAPGEVSYAASKHAALAFTLGTLFDLRRSGEKRIQVSAVCPDGVWSPMIEDKLDDPDAFGSFSGQMFMPDQIAERVEGLLDHPRPIITIPRWRGVALRLFDALPSLAIRLMPLVLRDARKRQASLKAQVESGSWPPPPGA